MKTFILLTSLLLTFSAFAIELPKGFKKEKVNIDGINFNVYRGGEGEPLLLLHGYAQSGLMWTKAMEHFKNKFSMIIPDIRGAGLSDAPPSGYDKVTMANDMKKIMDHYKISKARVVGHDIGLMVAYALAAKYPESVERLVLMDAFVPGVGPGDDIYNSPDIWHFRFNGPAPEKLVEGRERIYFDSLWDGLSAQPKSFPEDAKAQYLSYYQRPGRMKAGFEYFKAMPGDAKTNKELSKTKLPMPVMSIGGEKSMGQGLADTVKVVSNAPESIVIKNCGHWLMEECSQETLKGLDSFLTRTSITKEAQEE